MEHLTLWREAFAKAGITWDVEPTFGPGIYTFHRRAHGALPEWKFELHERKPMQVFIALRSQRLNSRGMSMQWIARSLRDKCEKEANLQLEKGFPEIADTWLRSSKAAGIVAGKLIAPGADTAFK